MEKLGFHHYVREPEPSKDWLYRPAEEAVSKRLKSLRDEGKIGSVHVFTLYPASWKYTLLDTFFHVYRKRRAILHPDADTVHEVFDEAKRKHEQAMAGAKKALREFHARLPEDSVCHDHTFNVPFEETGSQEDAALAESKHGISRRRKDGRYDILPPYVELFVPEPPKQKQGPWALLERFFGLRKP